MRIDHNPYASALIVEPDDTLDDLDEFVNTEGQGIGLTFGSIQVLDEDDEVRYTVEATQEHLVAIDREQLQ